MAHWNVAQKLNWIAAGIILSVACTSYVKRGSDLYADGRYVEAAEVFEHTEGRLSNSTPRQQAEYGLYRGLTLLVLGDIRNAHRWLSYAYEVERVHPGSLRANRRALLDRGWYELGKRMGEPPRAPSQPGTALAASQPPPPPKPPPRAKPEPDSGETRRSFGQ